MYRFTSAVGTCVCLLAILSTKTSDALPMRFSDDDHGEIRSVYGREDIQTTSALVQGEVVVAVKTRNKEKIEAILQSVSDPSSVQYGKHLSLKEICLLSEPLERHRQAVYDWAKLHSAVRIDETACRDFVVIKFPKALRFLALESAHLIAHAVDFIDSSSKDLLRGHSATTDVSRIRGRDFEPAVRRAALSATDAEQLLDSKPVGPWYPPCLKTSATPACLRRLHNVSATAAAGADTSQAVALFGPQYFRPADLVAFEEKFALPATTIRVLNDNDPKIAGNEASLDTQYITALGAGAETWFLHYNCTTEACRPFLGWVLQVANLTRPPLVQSVSVGTTEWEYVEAMGEPFVARINHEFAKLGARGVTLLFAAGDRASQAHAGRFWINFPAASPFVAAVGGVWLGALGGGPLETDPDTTGGFANSPTHAQPPHQRAAVERYLAVAAASGAKRPDVFNASLRAVPDLVSMSDAYVIIQGGSPTFIGGTSAACPVVAGLLSLINGALLAAGRGPLGLVTPLLYAHAECFEDVVGGANLYAAVEGWDPATGLGSPVHSCLLAAALAAAAAAAAAA